MVETLPWRHYQSSNPENVVDHVDIDGYPVNDTDVPIVNNAPIVNGDIPTVNNVLNDDDDSDIQETLRIFESSVEFNKRKRAEEEKRKRKREKEEDEFENVDVDALNAIIDVCSMHMDCEWGLLPTWKWYFWSNDIH